MTAIVPAQYRQYRAPSHDGGALIEPGLTELHEILDHGNPILRGTSLEFCGKRLEDARRQAREEVYGLAVEYTGNYLPVERSELGNRPIVLSGHQPELFHPGVWFKNYLLDSLASSSNAVAINFLVDNDICRRSSIRVPTLEGQNSANQPKGISVVDVPFDSERAAIPWELRSLGSKDVWNSFPERVLAVLPEVGGEPLLPKLWSAAQEAVSRTDRPGLAIAEARHRLERQLGMHTLEVPLSRLVSTRAFARFSIQLLAELPRLQSVYNDQLKRYRVAHRIRNHAHPVPALEQSQGWLEAPWWVYRPAAPRRQRLWVRLVDEQLMFSDRAGWQACIEGRLDCDSAASQWLDLLNDGVCLRPRALLTTMYLRIMVGDLFVHGIGGAKYDQLTDAIIRDFFDVQPPPMCVASATLHLPLTKDGAVDESTSDLLRNEKKRLWQLQHHAEQFVEDGGPEAEELIARKQSLLANIPPKGERWQWHRQITAVNQRLAEMAAEQVQIAQQRAERFADHRRRQRIENSREFSFCLYPLEYIHGKLSAASST